MVETQIKSVPDSVVFQVVEEMPDFPGGVQALMDYLSKNVRYPAEAHAIGAQGRVIVSFTVKKDGKHSRYESGAKCQSVSRQGSHA